MNKKIVTFFQIVAVLFVFVPQTVLGAEVIPSFDARVVVYKNATIEVTERILYDFGDNERHGIFRVIPYSYQAGNETYTAEVSSVLVTDGMGTPLPFTESRGNGELTLKIGDPNKTITGEHAYELTYVVEGPFLYYEDFDELYWNVTGYWEKPITNASVLVDLPVGAEVLQASCYKGKDGSKDQCDESVPLVNTERAGYNAKALDLKSEEGFTIAVSFPKGVIETELSQRRESSSGILSSWAFSPFIPSVVPFFLLLTLVYLWFTKGRDPDASKVIVTQFEPPEGMGPSVASVVYSEKVEDASIAAEILRLAVDGYIKIHRLEKDFLIFSLSDYVFARANDKVPADEVSARVLEKIFQDDFMSEEEIGGKKIQVALLSRMKNEFVDEKDAIEDLVYQTVTEENYFIQNPDKVRTWYVVATVLVNGISILWATGILLLGNNQGTSDFVWTYGPLAVILALAFFFSLHMPARTKEGVRLQTHLKGFKRYLDIAEKDRIAFHDAPEKKGDTPERTVEIFSRFLPYAVMFGVEENWAKQFEDIFTEAPQWYEGGNGTFSPSVFATDMKMFTQSVSTATMPQSSGSGGGGSVGGGFGGGGGGSW